mmetsp:Transcript_9388/g.21344  ORF Transcript_9388/g.21344 Transcript_9388/m.21344 type:complete len:378 (-) Transcript_9388:69-1202(-)
MESLRARLQRQVALRRAASTDTVDVEAVRSFWAKLDPEARQGVLRFEDQALVQRLHENMKALCRAEIWAMANGVEGVRDAEPPQRLTGFEFECPAELDCYGRQPSPIAFTATEEYAANDGLLEDLQRELGSPLLQGRPALRRQDWLTTFEGSSASWEDLQHRVLRLVELALFQAQQDAPASEGVGGLSPCAQPELEGGASKESPVAAAKSQSAKRRAAKKRKSAAAAQAAEQEAASAPVQGAPELAQEEREPEAEANEEVDVDKEEAADAAPEADSVAVEESKADTRPPQDAPHANQRSGWSTWLPSLLRDGTKEWQWVDFQPRWTQGDDGEEVMLPLEPTPAGFRAFVKNTFVDVEPIKQPQRRSLSLGERRSAFF